MSEWRYLIQAELESRLSSFRETCRKIEIQNLGDDQKVAREIRKIEDSRIHLILYFFDGHRVKEQDFVSVKQF